MKNHIQVNFAELEKLVWGATLETFQQALVEILSMIDDFLMAKRDKNRYEYKEKKERTCITMLGPVVIARRYYRDKDENEWVYLLDRALELPESTQVSAALQELVVLWATKGPSYRDVRDRLEDLFGERVLSHEKIRQILIRSSDMLKKTSREDTPKKGVEILFVEADGFWTGVQRRGKRVRKKRETKMVVVHEGWEERQGGGYRLQDPMYVTSDTLETGEGVWDRVRLRVADKYRNIDDIPVIINGDFASWIREGTEYFGDALYQYDRFHLKRDIRSTLRGQKELCTQALRRVDHHDPDGLLQILDQGLATAESETQREELAALKNRLKTRKDCVIDYRETLRRRGIEVPESWRGMGAAESNVDRFKLRTAKRGRSWSAAGLEAILHMLGMLFEGSLKEALGSLDSSMLLPEGTEELVEAHTCRIAKAVGTGVLYARNASFPAIYRGTQGYAKVFRKLLNVEAI